MKLVDPTWDCVRDVRVTSNHNKERKYRPQLKIFYAL